MVQVWQSTDLAAPVRAPRRTVPMSPQLAHIDPWAQPADPALIAVLGADVCMAEGLLPWRRCGGAVVVLAEPSARVEPLMARLQATFGPVRIARIPAPPLTLALARDAGGPLAEAAERRLPEAQSCRSLDADRLRPGATLRLAAVLLLLLALAPAPIFLGLCLLAGALSFTFALFRLACLFAARRTALPQTASQTASPSAILPVITLMVPLFREPEIAAKLARRLGRLDYPVSRLDLCLILEAEDRLTRAALAAAELPAHARIITIPAGGLKTKPHALNYALSFARGTIIGIYDAEDAPAPDQLRRVAARFATAPPDVACLQGALCYYNTGDGLLARCFALEYDAWFRVMLPGLARLGLPVPLGGTTLFVRRNMLLALGGWDAHNVTEDADLGLRIARQGWKTELIDTVTQEEATAHPRAWIRQRSRWQKGFAMTWANHMRRPRQLWRDLGPRGFWAMQLIFLGTLLQFLLAPVLWSGWALALGFPHVLRALPDWAIWVWLGSLLGGMAVSAVLFTLAAIRAGHRRLIFTIPLLGLYFSLATFSVLKALAEVIAKPFFWDKTTHGHSAAHVTPDPPLNGGPAPAVQRASAGS